MSEGYNIEHTPHKANGERVEDIQIREVDRSSLWKKKKNSIKNQIVKLNRFNVYKLKDLEDNGLLDIYLGTYGYRFNYPLVGFKVTEFGYVGI